MTRLVCLALLLSVWGCVPALTAASTTPSGQAAIERAVQRGLVRAGLAEPVASTASPARLVAGPMLADVTHRGAAVWVQAEGTAVVTVVATPAAGTAAPSVTARAATNPDGTATVRLFGLAPGTAYDYAVSLDGTAITVPFATTLATQPLWQYRTDPPTFTAAIGSCYYDNDPDFDRPGGAYGGSTAIFGEIAALRPDLMLWLGDNTYLREVDWWDPAGIAYRFRHSRAEPALQPLLASTAHYATWDDHDYGPNDSDRSYVLKGAALDTFTDFWPAATRGLPGVEGVFTQFQWADVDVFLLDDRYHRSPNNAPEAERTILGAEQAQWLLDALTASRAPFKVVAVGGQFLNPIPVFETFAAVAPVERQRLIDEITARRIDGVVFLSGDRHHTELLKMERPGAYPLYEFTSSPLTAGASTYPLREDSPERVNPLRVPGTLVAGDRNFGTLTVSGERTDRTMTMRTYDAEGTLLWEHAVRARALQHERSE
ncbi:alkaline phosphatase D family protein [Rubrivirga sp. IMCC43871]|uniref:alkaline phosphatase D family protein n=1 Tax=Rubrivirga sp. IMCC43871 TaxID=3391575 RepID=UPI00398FB499